MSTPYTREDFERMRDDRIRDDGAALEREALLSMVALLNSTYGGSLHVLLDAIRARGEVTCERR